MREERPWVRAHDDGTLLLEHLDGIPWSDRPRPRRWHRCTPSTRAWDDGVPVERCACGAIRNGSPTHPVPGRWVERNARG